MSVVRVGRPRAAVLFLVGAMLLASMVAGRPAEAADTASISGVVTNVDGQPLAGVTVQVHRLGSRDTTGWTTGADGRYVAEGLPAATYAVCFYQGSHLAECWEDIEPATASRTPVQVDEGQHVAGISAQLEPPSYLRGTVTDNRGAPVEGAAVSETWYAPDGSVQWGLEESTRTAADGSFEIGPLYSGEYTLGFSDHRLNRFATEWWDDAPTAAAARHIQLARGESKDHLDAVLDDLPHITGQVKGADGAAARGAQVRAFLVQGDSVYEVDSSPLAADGGYDVGGLEPGTYRLEFDAAPGKYRSEWWRNVRSIGGAHDVVISGTRSVSGIDAVLSVAPPVRATRVPVITGRTRVGERLRVTDGAWDVGPLRVTYQWRADGVAIPGATRQRLWLDRGLRGKRISVRAKATAIDRERSPGLVVARRTERVAGR